MATRKYKTVSGYLRSCDEDLHYSLPFDMADDARVAAIKAGLRRIINNLLPQKGLDRIEDSEKPIDGIRRLLAAGGTVTEDQVKTLKTIERWLERYLIPVRSKMRVSVNSGPVSINSGPVSIDSSAGFTHSMTYRGYNIEEVDDVYRISKDGVVVATQASEQAAFAWIDPLADEAVREGVRKREAASQASAAPQSFYRGHSIKQIGDTYVANHDGVTSTHSSEQAACSWIDEQIAAGVRKQEAAAQPVEPAARPKEAAAAQEAAADRLLLAPIEIQG